jgi:hypothetical protein
MSDDGGSGEVLFGEVFFNTFQPPYPNPRVPIRYTARTNHRKVPFKQLDLDGDSCKFKDISDIDECDLGALLTFDDQTFDDHCYCSTDPDNNTDLNLYMDKKLLHLHIEDGTNPAKHDHLNHQLNSCIGGCPIPIVSNNSNDSDEPLLFHRAKVNCNCTDDYCCDAHPTEEACKGDPANRCTWDTTDTNNGTCIMRNSNDVCIPCVSNPDCSSLYPCSKNNSKSSCEDEDDLPNRCSWNSDTNTCSTIISYCNDGYCCAACG